jgi:crystallin alpha B
LIIFQVKLDVHQFTPDEITVKTKDNNLIVEAKHEEKEDPHGFVSRQFSRRYVLPEDIRVENLLCNMSSDGVLAIEAPRAPPKLEGENVIPINQTGRPAVPAGTGVTTKNIEIERHSSPQSTAEANAPASSNQTS